MGSMLYKNLTLTKKIYMTLPIYVILYTIILKQPLSYLAGTLFIAAYLSSLTLFGHEEQAKATTFQKALPVKLSTVIGAYYINLLMVLGYALILGLIGSHVRSGIMPEILPPSLAEILLATALSLVVSSLQIPIIIRFGASKTRVFNLLFLMAIFALAGLSAHFLGIGSGTTSPFVAPALLGVALLVSLLSYAVSLTMYRKKEAD